MPDLYKSIKVTQPNPGGPLNEQLVGAVQVSGGAADAGKLVVLDASGQIDPSMISGGGGTTVYVNGTTVSAPNFTVSPPGAAPSPGAGYTSVIWTFDATSGDVTGWYSTTGSAVAFNDITSGDNLMATMQVGTGASLAYTGSGVVNANEVGGINYVSTPTHVGQIPIVQPGLTSIAYADPQVQGLYAAGSSISSPPSYVAPTTIQPVLIGASDGTDLQNILVDGSGNLKTVTASESATGGAVPTDASYIGWDSGGDLVGVSTSNPLPVAATFSGTVTTSLPPDRSVNTPPITALNNAVVLSCNPMGGGTISINVSGTWVGTLSFQASMDGTHYVTSDVTPYPFGSLVNSTTANGQWQVNAGGLNSFQVIATAWTSGTATVWIELGIGPNQIVIADIVQGDVSVNNFPSVQTVAGTVTAAQGSGGVAASAWYVFVTDGTNVLGTSAHPFVVDALQDGTWTVAVSSITAGGQVISSTDDSGTYGFNVHLTNTGGVSGTQYLEGTTAATPTGTVAMTKNPSNVIESLRSDASNNLLVNLNTALPTGSNLIGEVEVYNGTNVVFSTTHPGITQDVSDGTPGSSAPTTALAIAGRDTVSGDLVALNTTSGNLNVNASVSGTFTPALTSDRTSSGIINAVSNFVALSTQGTSSTVFNITTGGAWTGTVAFEASVDGTNWYPVFAYAKFPSGAAVQTVTSSATATVGQWQIPTGGVNEIRVIATAWTSGSITVWEEGGAGPLLVEVGQVTASNLNATVNLADVGGSAITLGQKTSVNSVPVVIASDQSSVDATLQASNANIGYTGYELPTASRMSYTAINFSSSGANTIIPGVGGETIRVWRILFNVGGSTTLIISDGFTTFSGPFTFTTSGGFALDFSGDPWYVTGLSNGFVFTTSEPVQVGGTVWWTQS